MRVTETQEWYLSNFQAFEKNLNGDQASPIHKIRKMAISRFVELGFPTVHDEEWKYTDVSPIVERTFKPTFAEAEAARWLPSLTIQDIQPFTLEEIGYHRIVFVNGYYSRELSYLHPPAKGVQIESLATAIEKDPVALVRYLSVGVGFPYSYEDNGFTALNTAFIRDGAFVYIPDGVIVEVPIHLIFVGIGNSEAASGDKTAPLSQPRNLIITGKNSQVALIESYVSPTSGSYFTNTITEVVMGENSVVDYYKLQYESLEAFHIGTVQVRQGRSSNFSSHSLSFGGRLVRNNITVVFEAEGGECTLNGLYVVTDRQHVDNHTMIDHAKPHCTSNELYKGILDGKSRGVFNGKILVRPDAQKTNAHQTNKNLLLSDEALIDTKPQLEIFANDVKCSHGATIGQLEEDPIFYLRSRGVDREMARTILTYAFASDIISRIKLEAVRTDIDRRLLSRFGK
jgi:Fe-S cluster assembly protein SufD